MNINKLQWMIVEVLQNWTLENYKNLEFFNVKFLYNLSFNFKDMEKRIAVTNSNSWFYYLQKEHSSNAE